MAKAKTDTTTPKRNPQDATSRNVRASRLRDVLQGNRLKKLEEAMARTIAAVAVMAKALGLDSHKLISRAVSKGKKAR